MKDTLVKICGITAAEEALWLGELGADMAGMVMFFPKSKRCVTVEQAGEILAALDERILSVAVTVEPTAEQIRAICRMGFDRVQVHGRLSPEAAQAAQIPILKAFNVTDLDSLGEYSQNSNIVGYVFDAAQYGSGKSFDWRLLEDINTAGRMKILAGGLTPRNVTAAIQAVRPDCVDVSSGVENDSGIGKDRDKIREFIENVRRSKFPE